MFALRPARPDELALVMSSWSREFVAECHRSAHVFADGTPTDRFCRLAGRKSEGRREQISIAPNILWAGHRGWVAEVASPDTVVVAELSDEPGEVIGWACREPGRVLHYVWTKKLARRMGVARELIRYVDAETDEPLRLSYLNELGRAVLSSARRGRNGQG